MDLQIEKFFHYINKAVKAERAQKYAKMWKYVAKAESFPIKTDLQRWTIAYAKAVYSLRYGAEEDLDEATQKLLKLRRFLLTVYFIKRIQVKRNRQQGTMHIRHNLMSKQIPVRKFREELIYIFFICMENMRAVLVDHNAIRIRSVIAVSTDMRSLLQH